MEADEPSLYSRREKLSLQYAIRLAANPSNPAHEVTFPPNYVDLYEQKPKAIKSFGIRISPLLESANIKPQNIEKRFTPNIPLPGRVAQSVTCLATDACLTAYPGVASSIPVRSHTFVEIDHEIISTVILLPSADHSRRVVVSYKRKYVHELLVNRLFKPAQEKVWLGELTVPQ